MGAVSRPTYAGGRRDFEILRNTFLNKVHCFAFILGAELNSFYSSLNKWFYNLNCLLNQKIIMQKEHHVIINLTQNHASLQYSSNLKRLKTTHSITKRLENIIFSHASAIISRTTQKKKLRELFIYYQMVFIPAHSYIWSHITHLLKIFLYSHL